MNSITIYLPLIRNKREEIERLKKFFYISSQISVNNNIYINDDENRLNIDITDKKVEFYFLEPLGNNIILLIKNYLSTYYNNILIGLKVYSKYDYYSMIECDDYKLVKY